jgi:hypothetical protein
MGPDRGWLARPAPRTCPAPRTGAGPPARTRARSTAQLTPAHTTPCGGSGLRGRPRPGRRTRPATGGSGQPSGWIRAGWIRAGREWRDPGRW